MGNCNQGGSGWSLLVRPLLVVNMNESCSATLEMSSTLHDSFFFSQAFLWLFLVDFSCGLNLSMKLLVFCCCNSFSSSKSLYFLRSGKKFCLKGVKNVVK